MLQCSSTAAPLLAGASSTAEYPRHQQQNRMPVVLAYHLTLPTTASCCWHHHDCLLAAQSPSEAPGEFGQHLFVDPWHNSCMYA